MKLVFPIHKKRGETPLEALEHFRGENPEYRDLPLTYAGRLDPAASGVLLVLVGEECENKKKYLKLPKEYRAEILLGVETDTYDLLGVIQSIDSLESFDTETCIEIPHHFEGSHMWPYPPYSSKTVGGKPLWQWAREGKLDEISIPTREMVFTSISLKEVLTQEAYTIQEGLEDLLGSISGDFRQEEIRESWNALPTRAFPLVTLDIECESGSYIRSLAHYIGEEFDTGAILFNLERVRVGEWQI